MDSSGDIEVLLWEYIDNACDDVTRVRVARNIATDEAWKNKYEELLSFNEELAGSLEAQEPSLRFTRNVMELIGQANPVPSVRNYVNPIIIKGIAAFFMVSLLVTTLFAFFAADKGEVTKVPISIPHIAWKAPDLSTYFNNNITLVLLSVNMVLGLIFLDAILAKRKKHYQQ